MDYKPALIQGLSLLIAFLTGMVFIGVMVLAHLDLIFYMIIGDRYFHQMIMIFLFITIALITYNKIYPIVERKVNEKMQQTQNPGTGKSRPAGSKKRRKKSGK